MFLGTRMHPRQISQYFQKKCSGHFVYWTSLGLGLVVTSLVELLSFLTHQFIRGSSEHLHTPPRTQTSSYSPYWMSVVMLTHCICCVFLLLWRTKRWIVPKWLQYTVWWATFYSRSPALRGLSLTSMCIREMHQQCFGELIFQFWWKMEINVKLLISDSQILCAHTTLWNLSTELYHVHCVNHQ